MKNTDNWKSAGSLQYSRMLGAYLNRVNSGVDRGDDDASFDRVEKDFAFSAANPTDWDARARGEAQAKKEEDGGRRMKTITVAASKNDSRAYSVRKFSNAPDLKYLRKISPNRDELTLNQQPMQVPTVNVF